MFAPEAMGPAHVIFGFFAHPMIMPKVQLVDRPGSGRWPLLLTQPSSPFSSGVLGSVALLLWLALLLAGGFSLTRLKERHKMGGLLGTVLASQLGLHLIFGNETFLYSLHWLPILVTVAALSTFEMNRTVVLSLAVGCSAMAGVHNLQQFVEARRFVMAHKPLIDERNDAEHREARLEDPWPTKAIEVNGGTTWAEEDIAAYEPGGGLWPALDTFQIGFWIIDSATGKIVTTSHDVASGSASHHHLAPASVQIDAVTSHYELTWVAREPRLWQLDLDAKNSAGSDLFVMVRAVGWRFNKIRAIEMEEPGLRINKRWHLAVDKSIGREIGIERGLGWPVAHVDLDKAEDPAGWVFARVGPLPSGKHHFTLSDEQRHGSIDTFWGVLSYASPHSGIIMLERPTEAR